MRESGFTHRALGHLRSAVILAAFVADQGGGSHHRLKFQNVDRVRTLADRVARRGGVWWLEKHMRPRLQMVVLALVAGLLAGGLALPDMALAANGSTTGSVNMRTGPGVSYPRIAVIPRGAAVTIRGCVRDSRWCDVSWRGWNGWVSARYLAWIRYSQPIYRPGYPPLWGGPVILFHFDTYNDRWYRDRPWYRQRHWHPKKKKRVIRRRRR